MGYCVDAEVHARIPAENVDAVFERWCELASKDNAKSGGSYSGGMRTQAWFSWMSADWPWIVPQIGETQLEAAVRDARFECHLEEDGSIVLDYFIGEKYGDDETVWGAVSDLVEGTIEWRGEDGALWCWEFGGPKLLIKDGRVVYG